MPVVGRIGSLAHGRIPRLKRNERGMVDEGLKTGQFPFAVGATVRVKRGTKDPDYPDMPLGGWVGVIKESRVETDGAVFLVEWNLHTLQQMHPVHRRRCQRDGLELTGSWLGADELEPDDGTTPQLEQPTDLRPRPLIPDVQEDRILAIFGHTSDDPWPAVNDANLHRYYDYLTANVTLPIIVEYVDPEKGLPQSAEPLKVVELLRPKAGAAAGGLLSVALRGDERQELPLSHLEPVREDRAWQLLADYAYWCVSAAPESKPHQEADQTPDETVAEARHTVLNAISRCGLYGAGAGAAVGAVAATMDNVLYSMAVGAVTLAVVGYVAGKRFGFAYGNRLQIKSGPILGGIFGLVGGVAVGVVAGPLVVAYLGTIFGSILGAVIGQILRMVHRRLPGPFVCGAVGTSLGAVVLAWTTNADQTVTGLLYGMPAGALVGLLLAGGFFGVLFLIESNRTKSD
jgi:hypothetical protein